MNVRRIAITATLGLGMAVAAAGPASAAPPLGASCHGQFNGTINPAVQGTGQQNSQDVAFVKNELGLIPGQIVKGEARLHDVDCTF